MIDGAPAAPPDRFYCAGHNRKDDDNHRRCDYRAPKRWYGYCPKCEMPFACLPIRNVNETKSSTTHALVGGDAPVAEHKKIPTHIKAVDDVLSGGLCDKTSYLLAGAPGAGKTQILLRVLDKVAKEDATAIYGSTEETAPVLREVAARIGITNTNIAVFGTDTVGGDIDALLKEIEQQKPRYVVVDSLQKGYVGSVYSDAGTSAQCNMVLNALTHYTQKHKVCMIVTSQITADGYVKGGMGLSHDVDVNLSLFACEASGEVCAVEESDLRVFSVGKTRRGAAGLKAIFRMTAGGLVEVSDEELEEMRPRRRRR